jgi:hypothetical protein
VLQMVANLSRDVGIRLTFGPPRYQVPEPTVRIIVMPTVHLRGVTLCFYHSSTRLNQAGQRIEPINNRAYYGDQR